MKTFYETLVEQTEQGAFGKSKKLQYAVKLNDVSRNDFLTLAISRRIQDGKIARDFQDEATHVEISAPGKDSLGAVKKWVEQNKPKEFFAKWMLDSHAFGKSFTVDLYYK